MKWVEAKALRNNTATSVAKFLYKVIWCEHGCLIKVISDQEGHFLGKVVESLTSFYVVVHKRNTSYYPQANRLAESTNKTLQNILRKIINENRTYWDTKLHSAFGLEVVMPIELHIRSLGIKVKERMSEKDSEPLVVRAGATTTKGICG